MLRGIAGDPTLSAALRAYDPAADRAPVYAIPESANPANPASLGASSSSTSPTGAAVSSFEKLLEQAGARADLSWFFADWVNADKGLPDLTIGEVFVAPEEAGNFLVTVTIANTGYAAVEVPVTVRSLSNSVTQRVRVPARGKASPHLLILGKPTEVQVNDGAIPETQATIHIKKLDAN
jgi:hypothetical protein